MCVAGSGSGTSKVKVRDIWNHADLADATNEIVTGPIAEGDSRFYLLTPVAASEDGDAHAGGGRVL